MVYPTPPNRRVQLRPSPSSRARTPVPETGRCRQLAEATPSEHVNGVQGARELDTCDRSEGQAGTNEGRASTAAVGVPVRIGVELQAANEEERESKRSPIMEKKIELWMRWLHGLLLLQPARTALASLGSRNSNFCRFWCRHCARRRTGACGLRTRSSVPAVVTVPDLVRLCLLQSFLLVHPALPRHVVAG